MASSVTFGIGRPRRAPEPLALSSVSEIPLTCSFDGTDDWGGITLLDDVAFGLGGPLMDSAEDMFVAKITQKFANLQYNITAGVCQKFGSKKAIMAKKTYLPVLSLENNLRVFNKPSRLIEAKTLIFSVFNLPGVISLLLSPLHQTGGFLKISKSPLSWNLRSFALRIYTKIHGLYLDKTG